jgi:L-seryl-tRNA(Ser) seleniumtransferase
MLTSAIRTFGRSAATNAARIVVDDIRSKLRGSAGTDEIAIDQICARIATLLEDKFAPSLRHSINATGIILHTGMGRAMLPKSAVEEVEDVIRGYSNLAVDAETGLRGSRDAHVSDLIRELTGAEAATVVNNNAAATMIVLNSLAQGKEVIVSRGQLVEIGGSFRMPDVMTSSGAILREVGTTNKTHLRDYAEAINENTGAILRVHTSNYRIVGFTEEPSIRDMVEIAAKNKIPVIDDLGSGALIDLHRYGLEAEPMIADSIDAGVDIACFSGDKLIGGPQCGIIVGKSDAVRKVRKNPLARALRVGKMTIAGLEATLRLFLNMDRLEQEHPTYRMLALTPEDLEPIARSTAESLAAACVGDAEIDVLDGESQVGSGSVPTETIPSKLLSVRPTRISSQAFSRALRRHAPPIFARIHDDTVLFDFRTIQPGEESTIEEAILRILKEG